MTEAATTTTETAVGKWARETIEAKTALTKAADQLRRLAESVPVSGPPAERLEAFAKVWNDYAGDKPPNARLINGITQTLIPAQSNPVEKVERLLLSLLSHGERLPVPPDAPASNVVTRSMVEGAAAPSMLHPGTMLLNLGQLPAGSWLRSLLPREECYLVGTDGTRPFLVLGSTENAWWRTDGTQGIVALTKQWRQSQLEEDADRRRKAKIEEEIQERRNRQMMATSGNLDDVQAELERLKARVAELEAGRTAEGASL